MVTFIVLEMNAATSTRPPCPTMMPAGLISHTRPFELSVPSSTEGSLPSTRFSTALLAEAWLNRVVSPAPMENVFQLMMAPLLFVTVSRPPFCAKAAVPLTTCGAVGFAQVDSEAKQAAIATAIRRLRLDNTGLNRLAILPPGIKKSALLVANAACYFFNQSVFSQTGKTGNFTLNFVKHCKSFGMPRA